MAEEDCWGGGGPSKASTKTPQSCPQEISVRYLPLHTPDPENMYGMYMIWRCTNTHNIQIICWKRFTQTSHPEPSVHTHRHAQTHFYPFFTHISKDSVKCGEDSMHPVVAVWRIGLTKL